MYEYRVIPAPLRGKKAKGLKTSSERFSFALQDVMNEQSADGWEYHRAETLPFEERSRMGRKSSSFQSVLIFRRLLLPEEAGNTPAEPYYAPPSEQAPVHQDNAAYAPEPEQEAQEIAPPTIEEEPQAEPLRATRPAWLRADE